MIKSHEILDSCFDEACSKSSGSAARVFSGICTWCCRCTVKALVKSTGTAGNHTTPTDSG